MTLVLLNGADEPLVVSREAEGIARREDVLRDMLFAHPAMLPVRDIDPSFGKLVAVAKELVIPDVGRIDADRFFVVFDRLAHVRVRAAPGNEDALQIRVVCIEIAAGRAVALRVGGRAFQQFRFQRLGHLPGDVVLRRT